MVETVNSVPNPLDDARMNSSGKLVQERDEEYWLDDGNVILIAGQAAFRLYKGLLARQSAIFCDMFIAVDPDPAATFDGCPVVHLSDSPEDLRALLQVLMPTKRKQ